MYHFFEMIPSEETQLAANAGKLELIKLHNLHTIFCFYVAPPFR